MVIHFVCRGNAFRSIMAEAYLNSLRLTDVSTLSSGTVAAAHKERNRANHDLTLDLLEARGLRAFAKSGYGDQLTQPRLDKGDLTVCLNERVYDDCLRIVCFPARPRVWSVADIGEPGRILAAGSDSRPYREQALLEVMRNVERLVTEVITG